MYIQSLLALSLSPCTRGTSTLMSSRSNCTSPASSPVPSSHKQETFKSLEKFANYGIESTHRFNKATIAQASSHFKDSNETELCTQQLHASFRHLHHRKENALPPVVKKFNRTSQKPQTKMWSERNLKLHPEIERLVSNE